MSILEFGPKPGVSETNEADYDTYPYCGDTRRTSYSPTDDGGVIEIVENLDTEGDSERSEYIHPQDR